MAFKTALRPSDSIFSEDKPRPSFSKQQLSGAHELRFQHENKAHQREAVFNLNRGYEGGLLPKSVGGGEGWALESTLGIRALSNMRDLKKGIVRFGKLKSYEEE